MATNNFYANHGTIWAITDELEPWDISDSEQSIRDQLDGRNGIEVNHEDEAEDDLRSYPGHCFASVTTKNINEALHAEAKIVIRSGYYSGMNFDYSLMFYSGYGGEYLERDDLDAELIQEIYEGYHGVKLSKAQAEQKLRGLDQQAALIEKHIEQVLTANTTSLIKTAQFSNGEAVYSRKVTA